MERAFLWVAELLFMVALGTFLRAYALRFEEARHRRWAGWGVGLVVGGLVILEVLKRGLGWQFPIRSRTVLTWHIGFASTSLLLLLIQVVTGVLRWRAVHTRAWPLTLGCFAVTIALSFFAFRLW